MLKGFKTKLDPNNEQRTKFAQHAGCARWAYNWGLDITLEAAQNRRSVAAPGPGFSKSRDEAQRERGEKAPKFPSSIDLHKKLNAEVKPEKQWFYDSSKCAPQQALRNLENAWKRYLTVPGSGIPKRKKKFVRDSFYLEGSIYVKDGFIQLPRIGLVRLHEAVPNQKLKSVTVSRKADTWLVSFKVEFEPTPAGKGFGRVGVDLGIKTLATLSTGKTYPALTPYRKNKTKLKKLQRQLARQTKGGKNREKTKTNIAKLHAKIANIRNDATHKLTSYLAKNHSEIVIEDLNVSGMMKNHKLASAIADSGFYEFKRQLEYKASWYGSTVIVIDRFYPSSQLCSECHHRQPMPLNVRTFDCGNCGASIDRDLNASINIEHYPITADSSSVEACGRDLPGEPDEAGIEQPRCYDK